MPKNFDIHYTESQRQALLNRWDAINTTATTEQLRVLMHDVLDLMLNDTQYTADDRQFSRAIDTTTGKPREPEYAHEFLMQNDTDYFSAWAYQFSPDFRVYAETNSITMDAVNRGLTKYTYFESDADIVHRSLLRNGLREREEGEEWPTPVLGSAAPAAVISVPQIVVTTTADSTVGGFR